MYHNGYGPVLGRNSPPKRIGGLLLLTLILILAACSGPTTSVPAAKADPTTVSQSNTFIPFKIGLPAAALNAPVKGPLPDTTPLHVGVTFKANQAVLDKLKKSGKGTNLEASAKELGISDELYQKIKDLFGVTDAKLKLDGLRTYLTVDAPAKTFAQILQTSFVERTFQGRTFFAPKNDPLIPNFLYPSILALTGLDNFTPAPKPQANIQAPKQTTLNPQICTPVQTYQTIGQLYGYDKLWNQGWHGEGMTVNLVGFSTASETQLNYFSNCVKYQGQLKTVKVDGGPDPENPGDAGWHGEVMEDIEMVQAMAPGANIVEYLSTSGDNTNFDDLWNNLNDALRQIIADNEKSTPAGSVVSLSFAIAEPYITDSLRLALDQSFILLTNGEHMTVFVATGDCGAFGGREWGKLSADFPATSPWVVAVGGTQFVKPVNGKRPAEEVWYDGSDKAKCLNQWGSGGGNSMYYAQPDWQRAPGVDSKYSQKRRQIPDLSLVASPEQIPMYDQAQWIGGGGTSASTPLLAAGFVLVNQGLLQQQHAFYYAPDTFYAVLADKTSHIYYDVTQGTDGYYPATPGWDYGTGLGTPNLGELFKALENISVPQFPSYF